MTSPRDELFQLLDRQVEGLLTSTDQDRISRLLTSDSALVGDFTRYLSLHGQLYWDAGLCAKSPIPVAADTSSADRASAEQRRRAEAPRTSRQSFSGRLLAVAVAVVAILGGWLAILPPSGSEPNIVQQGSVIPTLHSTVPQETSLVAQHETVTPSLEPLKPLEIDTDALPKGQREVVPPTIAGPGHRVARLPNQFDDQQVISEVNRLLQATWDEEEVVPSRRASDSEWVRRVYLTMVGRVPALDETERFLNDRSPRKRQSLITEVMADKERATHLAGVWTNLLVGRTVRTGVNRDSLYAFLADQFSANTPWIETVNELITATGRNDRNGATNFLLAHLNNEATPATAVTAKLFLGEQMSCVQCHDHPFTKDLRQQDYWALNAFFKDTERKTVSIANRSENMADTPWQLVDRPRAERMTFYETRSGLKKAVLPAYDGQTVSRDSQENRRKELARLLAADSENRVARAMVNRTWDHFFGFGFTNPVDDMGPHATVSHPELLNLLTEAFVKSDYDLQRLATWIAGSQAWHLSSQVVADNAADDPASGIAPLFTRVYVRRMTPEQVYESIRVAIRSVSTQPVKDGGAEDSRHRRDWVGQFAQAYGTDENDETLDFEGTIAQAMVMMNGTDVSQAIHQATDAIIRGSGKPTRSNPEALKRVALAMLTREPTSREQAAFRNYRDMLKLNANKAPMATAVEDMMWAYLNSSEFVLVH